MVERPERQIEAFAKAGADVITVHPEATPHIHYALQMIREQGCAAGVVINPGTPVDVVLPVAEMIDLCLVMSVNPGWGGQSYIPASTARLAALRGALPPEVVLEVDGGISLDTIDEARAAGADVLVAGSSVFGAAGPRGRLQGARGAALEPSPALPSHVSVRPCPGDSPRTVADVSGTGP